MLEGTYLLCHLLSSWLNTSHSFLTQGGFQFPYYRAFSPLNVLGFVVTFMPVRICVFMCVVVCVCACTCVCECVPVHVCVGECTHVPKM